MRPVYDMLSAAAKRKSGHMPGHKGRSPFGAIDPYLLDTTELPVTDDLYAPEGALLEAQALYAKAAGAATTLFLHNGSTQGIHVMLQLWAKEGDTVILPRNAHHSAIQACILGGLKPVWIPVTMRPDGYCYISVEDALTVLRAHPEAKVILLTRPDYFGCALKLDRIIPAAHAMGIRVLVDEAHGAHFPWLDTVPSAGACGADAWTQSVHKTLPGFTGSAVLHLRDSADRDAALRILRREQTSSPSFLLMLSIDDSRAWMEDRGRARLTELSRCVDLVRRKLPELGYTDARTLWTDTGSVFDPTRLVISAPQGGHALAASLAALGYDVEMCDDHRVVCILTAMDDPADVLRLPELLERIPPKAVVIPVLPDINPATEALLTPRQAVMSPCKHIPAEKAVGRIAAQAAGLYPPGIPLIIPGELVTEEIARLLQAAPDRERFGLEGGMLLCVNV